MKRRSGLIIILILLSTLSNLNYLKEAKAIHTTIGHYVIERQIALSSDDAYLYIDGGYSDDTYKIPLANNNYDIMIGLRFQNVSRNPSNETYYETIESSYLSFYTTDDYPAPLGDTLGTIYGIREEGDISTFNNYSDLIDREIWGYYPSNQNFNEVIGSGEWWNTTDIRHITRNLIKEDERDIGFTIYIESGGALRLFNTFDYNSSWGVKLYITVIQYSIYSPESDSNYIETYRGYDIYSLVRAGTKDYIFTEDESSHRLYYDTVHLRPATPIEFDTAESHTTDYGDRRMIIRLFNDTIGIVYDDELAGSAQIFIIYSHDNGTTWTDKTRISTLDGMENYNQINPSVAIDYNGFIHVVFSGYIGENTSGIYYVKHTTEWNTPILISTYTNMTLYTQSFPVIAIDEEDYIHVSWYGLTDEYYPINTQIWYVNKTSSWSYPFRISTFPSMENYAQTWVGITVDSLNMTHIAWVAKTNLTEQYKTQIYHSYKNITWSYPVRVSVRDGMIEDGQGGVTIASGYNENTVHIAWHGKIGTSSATRIWYSQFFNGSWSYPLNIATYPNMPGLIYSQSYPSIAGYPNGDIDVLWFGKCEGVDVTDPLIWLAWYNTVSGWDIDYVQDMVGRKKWYPKIRYSRYPLQYVKYVVKDENGTVISPVVNTVKECKEWINNYLSHSGGEQLDKWGDTILSLMGLSGFIMIPLSFWLFMANMHSDLENAFYLLMVFFIMGLAFVITWLWA